MKTLSNNDFSKALKSLQINIEAGMITIEDEVGTVCSYNRTTESGDANDTISIFGDEFKLTEKQMDTLNDILISESESYMNDIANAFSQEDKQHAINLIYS